jgi:hypothetical protein
VKGQAVTCKESRPGIATLGTIGSPQSLYPVIHSTNPDGH